MPVIVCEEDAFKIWASNHFLEKKYLILHFLSVVNPITRFFFTNNYFYPFSDVRPGNFIIN